MKTCDKLGRESGNFPITKKEQDAFDSKVMEMKYNNRIMGNI